MSKDQEKMTSFFKGEVFFYLTDPLMGDPISLYNPTYQGLIEIGVEPHYLTDEVLERMLKVAEEYKINIRKDVIFKGITW